jgi:hypothetical protein
MSIESITQKIDSRYNPEFDVPQNGQPPVTWVEAELVEAVKLLLARIENLEARLNRVSEREQEAHFRNKFGGV